MLRLNFPTIKNNAHRINRVAIFESSMCRVRSKGHEIFRSIIGFNFINMMAWFFRFKMATNLSFNYKPMLQNISPFTSMWMIRRKNPDITSRMLNYPTFPFNIIFSSIFSFPSFTHFFFCSLRMMTAKIPMIFTTWISSLQHLALFLKTISRMRLSVFINTMRAIYRNLPHFLFSFFRMFRTFYHNTNIIQYLRYICNIFKPLNINTLKEVNYA